MRGLGVGAGDGSGVGEGVGLGGRVGAPCCSYTQQRVNIVVSPLGGTAINSVSMIV